MRLDEEIRGTETVYLLIMRIIGALCVIVSVVTVFLILKHSSKEMKHYKWMLLNQTLWTCNFGLLLGLLWIPIPLFPAMAAYIRGPLSVLEKNGAHIIMCILSGSAMAISMSILVEIFFRYATIARLRLYYVMASFKMVYIMIALNVFSFGSGFIVNFLANVPYPILREKTLEHLSDLESIFETEVVFGYTLDNPYIMAYGAYTLIFFLIFSVVANIFIWLLIRSLYKQKTLMGKRNFNIQMSLFTALAIQFCIPFFFGVIPTSLVTVLVQLHFEDVTSICEACLCLGCLHTVLSNLTTVLIVKPYRKAALKYLSTGLFVMTGRHFKLAQSSNVMLPPSIIGLASSLPTTNISAISRSEYHSAIATVHSIIRQFIFRASQIPRTQTPMSPIG